MKIFFFSTVFSPSVGGVENVVETLCREFVRAGHQVRLATLTPEPSNADFPFEEMLRVYREVYPSFNTDELKGEGDDVFSNSRYGEATTKTRKRTFSR